METDFAEERQKLSGLEDYADLLRQQQNESQERIESLQFENE